MRAADAFMLPSAYEGFALVTIEAAASGLPLLVTEETGAGPLARAAGGDALPRDAAAFAGELTRLGGSRAARAALSARARESAERFAWPRVIDGYAGAYAIQEPHAADAPAMR
jgi:glycosyltransferase involved in cell wall biosynthesis